MRIIKTLLSITIGIIIANILIEMKLNKYFKKLLKPFIKFSRLRSEVWLGIFTRILSPYAGYEVLHRLYTKGKINEKEIIVVTLITPFPYEIMRIVNYYFPIVIPLLGFSLGFKYMLLKLISSFIQTFSAFVYARSSLGEYYVNRNDKGYEELADIKNEENISEKISRALKNSLKTLKKILPIFIVTVIAIKALEHIGAVDKISQISKPITNLLSLPGESSIIIVTLFINLFAGYALAGELFKNGEIGEKEALITLAVGLMITLPRIFAQSTLPIVASLFGKKLALKIIVTKISLEVFSIIVALIILLHFI